MAVKASLQWAVAALKTNFPAVFAIMALALIALGAVIALPRWSALIVGAVMWIDLTLGRWLGGRR